LSTSYFVVNIPSHAVKAFFVHTTPHNDSYSLVSVDKISYANTLAFLMLKTNKKTLVSYEKQMKNHEEILVVFHRLLQVWI